MPLKSLVRDACGGITRLWFPFVCLWNVRPSTTGEVEAQLHGMGLFAGGNDGRCMHSLFEHTDVTAMDNETLICLRNWDSECPTYTNWT